MTVHEALSIYSLTFVPQGDDVLVGRADTGEYAVLGADGAALLRKLSDGASPSDAAAWYLETYHEPVDLEDFLQVLDELGFIRAAGDQEAPEPSLPLRRVGQLLFSAPAWVLYLALTCVAVVESVRHPDLWPAPSHIFFCSSVLIVQLTITFGQVPLLFLHEGFHISAGQRLGLVGRLTMSNRLMYVVFETKLNGLLGVTRNKRYLPFLAGMVSDVVVLSVFVLVAEGTRGGDGHFSLLGRLCLALAFTVVMRLGWQFQLHLRTDLYYVFSTALNCFDLHDASKGLLANRLWRRLGRPNRLLDEDQWSAHDRRVGRWYGPFLVIGVVTTLGLAVLGSLPVAGQYFGVIGRGLTADVSSEQFWDAAVSLAINVGQVVLLIALSRRKKRAARGRAPRLMVS